MKELLIIVALSTILGGTTYYVDSRIDRATKPIEKDIAEMRADIKDIGNHLRVWK